jgi:translation elongation factor EF-Ts
LESKLGEGISVVNFVRAEVGAGLEVEKVDLAQEVAKMTEV